VASAPSARRASSAFQILACRFMLSSGSEPDPGA
jgi:hypothetical protein